ncbi:MAG: Hsp20/alpha crystallin family protein [Spirochaetes bacterium]|nr:MAG: Hsp20/alpha crystallin family protein [Spirochaetota bacterium]
MNIIKRKPTALDIFDLDRLDRFIERFFEDATEEVKVPAVDIKEEKDKYIMEVELPGFTEKDVELKVENNVLTLSSKKEETKEESKKGYIRKERKSYSFSRSFSLPENTDVDKIKASFKNGILNIEIPKEPESQPKYIEVKSEK